MSLSTYKKRGGTSDRGKDYEWLLCAFYSLTFTTSSKIKDFELYTNNYFFGDFDDVTIRATFSDNSVKVFLLQLKHSEKSKTLTLNSLTSQSGEFSLLKYQKTFNCILSLPNFYFILYVNRTANFRDKTLVSLEGEDLRIAHRKCVADDLLNTNKKRAIFRFESTTNQEFFSNFYLYANQQNDTNIKQSIADILKSTFCCDVYSVFVEFMRTWWAGNFVLTKQDIIVKLSELVLSPMVRTLSDEHLNAETILIAEAIMQHDVTLLGGSNEMISKIWTSDVANLDLKCISLTALKYGLSMKGINKIDDLSLEKKAKVFWIMNLHPLIVEVDETKSEQIESVLKFLEKLDKKKPVVLSGNFKSKANLKVFKDVSDLSENLRQKITNTFTVTLQGKPRITLKELGNFKAFKVCQLLDIATSDVFNIGEDLEQLVPSYIPRHFYKIVLSYKVLDGLKRSKILLSCNGQRHLIQGKFTKEAIDISNPDRRMNFFKYNIFVCEDGFPKDVVNKEMSCDIPTHHFKVLDGKNLQWLASNTKISELEPYRKKCDYTVHESDVSENFQCPIKIFSAHTGTGKTSFLARVKNEYPSNNFIIRINLKDHSEFFKSSHSIGAVWKYVVHFTSQKRKYNNFEQDLLSNFDKKKVMILWDSLDEMQAETNEFFLQSVLDLRSAGVTQWIAAQKRFQRHLEETCGAFSLSVVPFTHEEQTKYFQERCRKNFDITSFFENMKIIDNQEYLGVPLQLYILTEIFSKDPAVVDKLYTLTDMISAFIEGRYNHFLIRNNELNIRGMMSFIQDAKSHRLNQYKIAALKTYLPELHQNLKLENTSTFLSEVKQGDFLGLIEGIENQEFVFEHQIFGQYLSALYLAENRPQGLEDFLFLTKNRNVRFMFDLILSENEAALVAILYKRFDSEFPANVKDKVGRSPLHLICSYGQKHPTLPEKCEGPMCLIDTDLANYVEADGRDLTNFVKSLSEIYDSNAKDTLFEWTCFDYADQSCSLGLLETLNANIDCLRNYTSTVLLYYAIRFNYSRIFNLLKDIPYVEDTNGSNLLHLATEFKREEFLTRILSLETYKVLINKPNEDQWTPLHIATYDGNLPLMKFLIENGATLALAEPSLMSLAVAKGRRDLIEFFLDYGLSPNEFYHTNHFTTSIFQAIDQKQNAIVDLLIRNGGKLYCVNREDESNEKPNPYSMNLFHMLLENEQFEEAEFVLSKGVHIDSVDNKGRTAFHHAAISNNEKVVRFLLAKGGNLQIVCDNGQTPLHCAASNGSIDVARILVQEGLDTNKTDDGGLAPLHVAVLSGQLEFVEYLLQEGVDPDVSNKHGRTPMHLAAIYDAYDSLLVLEKYGANLEARDGLYGRTPLHLAAWNDNENCVQFFVDQGCQVDIVCNFGFTPLHLATEEGAIKSCKLLVEKGASVSIKNRNDVKPVDLIPKGYSVLARLFMRHCAAPLHLAVARDDFQFTEELIDLDYDINAIDSEGNTALHVACNRRNGSIVSLLLKKDADFTIQNAQGLTVLHVALQNPYKNFDIMHLVLHERLVNISSADKVTPLHLAARFGLTNILGMLIEKGSDIDAQNAVGFTALHYASCNDILDVVRNLVQSNCKINLKTKTGRTALHLAATRGHLSIVKFLLDKGAISVEDSYGDTPVSDAIRSEHAKVTELLLDDFSVKYEGRTPLHVAARRGDLDLVQLYSQHISIDAVDSQGTTPLEDALYNNQYDVFEFLQAKTAELDVNKFSQKYGKYPLHAVAESGRYKLVKSFLSQGARTDTIDENGDTPLHKAAKSLKPEIFFALLEYAAPALNMKDQNGQTVLHILAAQREATKILETLIEKDIDVDLEDNEGNTAFDIMFSNDRLNFLLLQKTTNLEVNRIGIYSCFSILHLAVCYKSLEIIKHLKEKNISPNLRDPNGNSPLHRAADSDIQVLRVLLETFKDTIDIELKNNDGETALHVAASSSLKNVQELVKWGASLYSRTKYEAIPLFYALRNPQCFRFLYNLTPEVEISHSTSHMARTMLHIAAGRDDVESVLFFLDVGLKINEADTDGSTPLFESVREGNLKVLEILLARDDKRVIVNLCNGKGYSLLHVAVGNRRLEFVKMLLQHGAKIDVCTRYGDTAADLAQKLEFVEIHEFLKGWKA